MQAARDRQKSFRLGIKLCLKFRLRKKSAKQGSQYILCIQLEKVFADEPLAVPLDGLHFDNKIQFVEEPIEIMDRKVKWLRKSRVPIVKVGWNFKRGLEFTWEREDQFKKKYLHLFTKTVPSSSAAF
ncbi:hypothetical protein Tco_0183062 [Tanacetum coccineum]